MSTYLYIIKKEERRALPVKLVVVFPFPAPRRLGWSRPPPALPSPLCASRLRSRPRRAQWLVCARRRNWKCRASALSGRGMAPAVALSVPGGVRWFCRAAALVSAATPSASPPPPSGAGAPFGRVRPPGVRFTQSGQWRSELRGIAGNKTAAPPTNCVKDAASALASHRLGR